MHNNNWLKAVLALTPSPHHHTLNGRITCFSLQPKDTVISSKCSLYLAKYFHFGLKTFENIWLTSLVCIRIWMSPFPRNHKCLTNQYWEFSCHIYYSITFSHKVISIRVILSVWLKEYAYTIFIWTLYLQYIGLKLQARLKFANTQTNRHKTICPIPSDLEYVLFFFLPKTLRCHNS